jgi:hypothetical protein
LLIVTGRRLQKSKEKVTHKVKEEIRLLEHCNVQKDEKNDVGSRKAELQHTSVVTDGDNIRLACK